MFGAKPDAMYLVGSRAEKALGAAIDVSKSDIDVFIETGLKLTKHEGVGFEFFKGVNPGRVPAGVAGIGPGPTQAFIGTGIPKPGLVDPFFGTAADLIEGAPAIPLLF